MVKIGGAPNINPELSSIDTGANVDDGKKPESGPMSEEIEVGQGTKKPELSPKEQIENLESMINTRQQRIANLTESVEATRTELDEERKKLGLPSKEEEPPYVLSDKKELEKLKSEQEVAEKQKEDLENQQEKERLIQEEKEKILQEKLDELFKEFEEFDSRDLESIFKGGKTRKGKNVESSSMGELDPETAKSLARAFGEGIKLLPKILEMLPDLLKKFDEELTKEATERVEKRLREEKLTEEQKKEEGESKKPESEEKSETPGNEIPSSEAGQGPSVAESVSAEIPKV